MKITFNCALVLLSLIGSASVVAETDKTGFYVGGEFGAIKIKPDVSGAESKSGQSYGAYGGYNFNDWFGLEGTVYASSDFSDNGDDSLTLSSFAVSPKFTFVLNETFSLYGKMGLSFTGMRIDANNDRYIDYFGASFIIGAGVNAALTEHLNLRLGYDYTSVSLDSNDYGGENDIDLDVSRFTLGMHYQF